MLPESMPSIGGDRPYRVLSSQDARISELCGLVARHANAIWGDLGRRSQQRVPYTELIQLRPLNDDGTLADHPPVYVAGKHLAPMGLDFYQQEPLAYRQAIVSLEAAPDTWLHLILKIGWCRFLKPGWYDSGGRFTKVVDWMPGIEGKPDHGEQDRARLTDEAEDEAL